jgi:type I restriction enzyme, S subunit
VLAKAFRGELVPQDPTDEPASALLARIASSNTGVVGKNKQKVPVTRKERAQAAINL